MELNTINKTGTWSETADRINSNFSKISIEVEEIKQNGGGGSGGGGGGDVTNADHANSAYTLDKNTPVLDWFLSALNDDDAQGIVLSAQNDNTVVQFLVSANGKSVKVRTKWWGDGWSEWNLIGS